MQGLVGDGAGCGLVTFLALAHIVDHYGTVECISHSYTKTWVLRMCCESSQTIYIHAMRDKVPPDAYVDKTWRNAFNAQSMKGFIAASKTTKNRSWRTSSILHFVYTRNIDHVQNKAIMWFPLQNGLPVPASSLNVSVMTAMKPRQPPVYPKCCIEGNGYVTTMCL